MDQIEEKDELKMSLLYRCFADFVISANIIYQSKIVNVLDLHNSLCSMIFGLEICDTFERIDWGIEYKLCSLQFPIGIDRLNSSMTEEQLRQTKIILSNELIEYLDAIKKVGDIQDKILTRISNSK